VIQIGRLARGSNRNGVYIDFSIRYSLVQRQHIKTFIGLFQRIFWLEPVRSFVNDVEEIIIRVHSGGPQSKSVHLHTTQPRQPRDHFFALGTNIVLALALAFPTTTSRCVDVRPKIFSHGLIGFSHVPIGCRQWDTLFRDALLPAFKGDTQGFQEDQCGFSSRPLVVSETRVPTNLRTGRLSLGCPGLHIRSWFPTNGVVFFFNLVHPSCRVRLAGSVLVGGVGKDIFFVA